MVSDQLVDIAGMLSRRDKSSLDAFLHLDAHLALEWRLWHEITIGTDRMDGLCMHPELGIVLVEAKRWHVASENRSYALQFQGARPTTGDSWRIHYTRPSDERTADDKREGEAWEEDPFRQLERYGENLSRFASDQGFSALPIRALLIFTESDREDAAAFLQPLRDDIHAQLDLETVICGADDVSRVTVTGSSCFSPSGWQERIACGWDSDVCDRLAACLGDCVPRGLHQSANKAA
jgi:hypothetical protein